MSVDKLASLTAYQRQMIGANLDAGYARWAGVDLLDVGGGKARIAFKPRAEMLTPWGTLNGGVISSLVETPSFFALATTLADAELPVTNDIFVQFMRPLPGDVVYEMTGAVLRRGRTMAWVDVVVTVSGEAVSLARITKTLLARARRTSERRLPPDPNPELRTTMWCKAGRKVDAEFQTQEVAGRRMGSALRNIPGG